MNVCNERVITETIIETGESRKMIESVIGHQSKLIAGKIAEGGFESIRILHFGIFQAKLTSIQWKGFIQSLPKSTTSKS